MTPSSNKVRVTTYVEALLRQSFLWSPNYSRGISKATLHLCTYFPVAFLFLHGDARPSQRNTYSMITRLIQIWVCYISLFVLTSWYLLAFQPFHLDHVSYLCSFLALSPSLSLFCHTVTLFRHTPPLSHAAILHNSNSAFIPLPLFSPWSLSFLSLIFFLLLATSSCFHSRPLLFLPFSMCGIYSPPFSPYLPLSVFICIPLLSSSALSFRSLPFTCRNGHLFTASLPIFLSAVLTFSPTHTRREKHDHEGVCHPV